MHDFWGIHWQRTHPDDEWDGEYIRRFQPVSIKLFQPEWSNKMFCDWLLSQAPSSTYFIIRDHALSEQKADMYTAPSATGQRHAREFAEKISHGRFHLPLNRCYFEGVNEPDTNAYWSEINSYWMAFILEASRNGMKASAFSFGTGHPSTVGRQSHTPVDYSHYSKAVDLLLQNGGHLNIHLYGSATNIAVPGHLTRWSNCPWPVPVDITEFGVDAGVDKGGDIRGYKAFDQTSKPEDYVNYLDFQQQKARENLGKLTCKSIMPFTFDHAQPWGTFDIRRDVANLMASRREWRKPSTGGSVNIPIVVKPGPVEPPPSPVPLPAGALDPILVAAIIEVESGGKGFNPDGSLKIRFEAHIFKSELKNDPLFDQHFRLPASDRYNAEYFHDGLWKKIHASQGDEYRAFVIAQRLNDNATHRSTSFGVGQIMGFNALRVGYSSAKAMAESFWKGEPSQYAALFNYFLTDAALLTAMRNKDWRRVVQLYNGVGLEGIYLPRLRAAYERYGGRWE